MAVSAVMVEIFYKLVKNGKDIESIKDPQIKEAVKEKLKAEE